MPSTKTQKLARRCRRTEEATDAYASVAGDVLEERFRPFLSEEEARLFPPGAVAKILQSIGVDAVRGAHQAFVEADEASARTAEEYARLCRQRDDTAAAPRPDPLGVDEDCVNEMLQMGAATGPWIPLVNDCWAFVGRVTTKCKKRDPRNLGRPGYRTSPL